MTLTSFRWQYEKFLQLVQNVTNDWAGLVHATGGLLTEMHLVHAQLGVEEGQGTPQDPL
jgi:hypothetical protein